MKRLLTPDRIKAILKFTLKTLWFGSWKAVIGIIAIVVLLTSFRMLPMSSVLVVAVFMFVIYRLLLRGR